ILAYWNLFAHIKNLQNTSRTRMESLRFLFITGVFFSLLAVVAFVTFLSIAIINKESLTNPLSFYMSSVWSVVSFKWAVLLVLTANHYRKEFNSIDILQDS
ncbi:heme transporter hrg1-A-like, partial [Nematolebias whitei]|uniref:heme transporter hrg1-A-like n=1 Tax=Nematolebias whitei TaxID=451745 RepID=UPI001896E023